ncbi:ATP-dependent RNA helicase [Candidatus Pacearchaeota archaeon]|jgi:ATP-dependent RNA helicase DeaD|nr:ATP-dependent RNA helicase [Candidatus Pacearchaeota archaeon]|tara:strand:- start:3973 stop:5208 length:1236 start_codon:yes stop_codon:yes gene_type:complete
MNKFKDLKLSKELLKVIEELGFNEPTEIQEKAIPIALDGYDIIAGSFTGSGKTLAFSVPIIEKLKPGKNVQALILTPTRELAEQVANAIKTFSKNKLNILSIYGGVNIEAQIKKLSKTDIIVGTPGRILDHINRRTLRLDHIKFLVLDEVDKMFDMGFHRDVEKIIKDCPKQRQTMLFSATISSDVDHLAKKYTKDAKEIAVNSYVDTSKLKQIFYDVPNQIKFSLLVHLLKKDKSDLAMVFCNTRRNVDFVANNLSRLGINSKAIHGGLSQNNRLRVLDQFHGKGIKVLICTDVAARGLDIRGVSHVYNYDIPSSSKDYIHRIGRTARAGKEGIAVSILCSRDYENFSSVLEDKSIAIKREELPFVEVVKINTFAGKRNTGRFNRDNRFKRNNQSNRHGSSRRKIRAHSF